MFPHDFVHALAELLVCPVAIPAPAVRMDVRAVRNAGAEDVVECLGLGEVYLRGPYDVRPARLHEQARLEEWKSVLGSIPVEDGEDWLKTLDAFEQIDEDMWK